VVNGAQAAAAAAANRYMLVDALRGCAIVLMVGYHFSFDLNYFYRLGLDFNHDPLWLNLRVFIVSLFLGLVGISLHLAMRHGFNRARYLRRLGAIVACAGLVTAASLAMFPRSFIYFGILHFIAVASVVALPMARLFWTNLWLGAALVVLGTSVQLPMFDRPPLQWIGLMTHKPITEDYVPLLPWLGVVLIGIFIGRWLYREPLPRLAGWRTTAPVGRVLAFGGRHSLFIYMAHQPLLFAVLYLLTSIR